MLLRREDSEAGLPSECPASIRFIYIRVVLTDVDCQVFGRMTVDTEADRTDAMLSVDICRNRQLIDDLEHGPGLLIRHRVNQHSLLQNVDEGCLIDPLVL